MEKKIIELDYNSLALFSLCQQFFLLKGHEQPLSTIHDFTGDTNGVVQMINNIYTMG